MRIALPTRALVLALAWLALAAVNGIAQTAHPSGGQMSGGPLRIPESRLGSGTSWLPDATPMRGTNLSADGWDLMLHASAFVQYDQQGGPRGSDQLGVVNSGMIAAGRGIAGGRLLLRGMLSAEPWTVGAADYPLLLQSGETLNGAPIHDRQHPHDLFMELAAQYARPISPRLGVSLYLAPVGEPSVGPVSFPHRPSAVNDPLAPISHHWQDATHITFGVVTLGVFTHTCKIEGSTFNGREPDENRTNFDYAGRRLDSYSARLSCNPGSRWSVSGWYAYLASPDALNPDQSVRRFGAAILTEQRWAGRGKWSSALIYGANQYEGVAAPDGSVLLESNVDFNGRDAVFGRAEYVRKSGADLAVPSVPGQALYDLGSLTLGYHRRVTSWGAVQFGLGALGIADLVPQGLGGTYGSRTPLGLVVYASLQSAGSRMMAGMSMPSP